MSLEIPRRKRKMSNFHQLILINGMAASGKSTFAKFCIDYAKRKYGVNGEELSTVDWVKEVARFCGWDGKKTELDRRFLSDLKFALERWDGSPVTSVLDKLKSTLRMSPGLVLSTAGNPEILMTLFSSIWRRLTGPALPFLSKTTELRRLPPIPLMPESLIITMIFISTIIRI